MNPKIWKSGRKANTLILLAFTSLLPLRIIAFLRNISEAILICALRELTSYEIIFGISVVPDDKKANSVAYVTIGCCSC
jgi:hypothetical protein